MGKVYKKLLNKIKEISPSMYYSPYVEEYMFVSNARSGLYLGFIVAALEIWMLITVITGAINSDAQMGFQWIFEHTISYIILLLTAIAMIFYSVAYLNKKIKNKTAGHILKFFFMVISITFGLYISYASIDRSGQVFAFITMEVFCLCILVWHPINHFLILTASFGIYLYIQSLKAPISYSIKVNSFTLWIALLMAGINIHHQRRIEAQKDENLEKLTRDLRRKATQDELTGLPNLNSFQNSVSELLSNPSVDISSKRFLFMDIENFKNYNEKYGFKNGNKILRIIGKMIMDFFPDEITARFSDDHFIAFVDSRNLEKRLKILKEKISAVEASVNLKLKCGIYAPSDREASPAIALDHARYACESIKKHFSFDVAEYNKDMDTDFHRKQYIINNLDSALKNNYIKAYYQPVVWAESGKLCGAEALARWISPDYGLLSPAEFIPILEEYHLIHKLDMHVLKTVCKDLHEAYKNNYPILPISINFSRLDFEVADPVSALSHCIRQYKLSKENIHVEITESALSKTNIKLKKAMEDFRARGYSLWLDDFGSGYSGLNVLKEFSFDTMKIDMTFLERFSENEKTRPILSSIISLAQKIGMQTLTEGVETEEACAFLRSIGCLRLQGYLFGKPMPKEEFLAKILSSEYQVDSTFTSKRAV